MAIVTSNSSLYPPVVNNAVTVMVEKDKNNNRIIRIPFQFSLYNTQEDVEGWIHVIVKQNNTSIYNGIFCCKIFNKDNMYYIEMPLNDPNYQLQYQQLYSFQFRFILKDTYYFIKERDDSYFLISSPSDYGTYITPYLDKFSEWSKKEIVKIIPPLKSISITYINGKHQDYNLTVKEDQSEFQSYSFITNQFLNFQGKILFNNSSIYNQIISAIKKYRVKITTGYGNEKKEVENSDWIYPIEKTQNFSFQGTVILQKYTQYNLEIEFETVDNFVFSTFNHFTITQIEADDVLPIEDIVVKPIYEQNSLLINFLCNNNFSSIIAIKRTDSDSNFTKWIDVFYGQISDNFSISPQLTLLTSKELQEYHNPNINFGFSWIDRTIESGKEYKYCIQRRRSEIRAGLINKYSNAQSIVFDNISLLGERGQELQIVFDPSIDNYSQHYADSITETFGQYPFVGRKGRINYKQFSLSGTISHDGDFEEQFYQYNNNDNLSSTDNDIVREKNFRDKVINFLYDNNIKLFKSATEGNILVKLTDISFSPKKELGRRIYSFSATATEIDNFSYSNCIKYNLVDNNKLSDLVVDNLIKKDFCKQKKYDYVSSGDETINIFEDIKNDLLFEYENDFEYGLNTPINSIKNMTLNFIRLHFDGDCNADDGTNRYQFKINLNGKEKTVYVLKDRAFFELKDVNINNLTFLKKENTKLTIEYAGTVTLTHKYYYLANTQYNNICGQLINNYNKENNNIKDMIKDIEQKYSYTINTNSNIYTQDLQSIQGIRIEANEGTIFSIRDSFSSKLHYFYINDTQSLELSSDEENICNIQNLYINGKILPSDKEYVFKESGPNFPKPAKEGELFILGNISDQNPNNLPVVKGTLSKKNENPEINNQQLSISSEQLYDINTITAQQTGTKYIFKNNQWHKYGEDIDSNIQYYEDDIIATVTYWGETRKGEVIADEI
ncbi:MAG: hypothetical protein MSA65_03690 [Mollicutes bacterium]|nr:hypothetical protein [Mollicutes bacterium]